MTRILLADDESIFLEFMQTILNWGKYGCEICACVKDGRAALDVILSEKPDVAFIDISMPLMDGIEVCREVRKRKLPVKLVIVTGHDEFSFAYQAIKIGIDDYLLKPFTREELTEAVQKAVQGLEQAETAGSEKKLENMGEGKTKYEIMSHAIEEYLNQNYGKKSLSLQEVATAMGFENSYLRRVYKMTKGITIMQKLEDIRITKAKQYLESGSYQNQEISELVGFSDPFYFSKRFKQCCGITPSEYRQKNVRI